MRRRWIVQAYANLVVGCVMHAPAEPGIITPTAQLLGRLLQVSVQEAFWGPSEAGKRPTMEAELMRPPYSR